MAASFYTVASPAPAALTLRTARRFGWQRAIVRVHRRAGGCRAAENIRSRVLRVGGTVVGSGGLRWWRVDGSTGQGMAPLDQRSALENRVCSGVNKP